MQRLKPILGLLERGGKEVTPTKTPFTYAAIMSLVLII